MCGILGTINSPFGERELALIQRRGPDDWGIERYDVCGQHITLGHRRLSIVDLSPNGHQPMSSDCGKYHIIFNGEIYNHQDFRNQLQNKTFRGHSDTETILYALKEKGISLQIFEMAKSAFSKIPQPQSEDEYTIAINLSERSFYKNVESARSLYTHYQLFSKSGQCVLENVFCAEGKNSILSTLIQQKQIERIARDVKKYLASGSSDEA